MDGWRTHTDQQPQLVRGTILAHGPATNWHAHTRPVAGRRFHAALLLVLAHGWQQPVGLPQIRLP